MDDGTKGAPSRCGFGRDGQDAPGPQGEVYHDPNGREYTLSRCPVCGTPPGETPDVVCAVLALVAVFGIQALRDKLCERHATVVRGIVDGVAQSRGAQSLNRAARRRAQHQG